MISFTYLHVSIVFSYTSDLFYRRRDREHLVSAPEHRLTANSVMISFTYLHVSIVLAYIWALLQDMILDLPVLERLNPKIGLI